jgi:2-(1,2-epoxy-1,2-dihydrophenyl)acetyl-CoA isomerase
MEYKEILVEKKNKVEIITLNRPEVLNAISMKLRKELIDAIRKAKNDSEVRVILLTGAGKAFSSGGDIREQKLAREQPVLEREERLRLMKELILEISTMEKPVIAAVNGVAAGAGVSLALACDLVFASSEARFILAFTRVGLVPDTGCTYFLPRMAGLQKAKELVFSGEPIDAFLAEKLGIVNRVFQPKELLERSMAFAEKLADSAPVAIGLSKLALNRAMVSNLEECLDYEAYLQSICFQTEDHKEGILAFQQKRKPEFKGK